MTKTLEEIKSFSGNFGHQGYCYTDNFLSWDRCNPCTLLQATMAFDIKFFSKLQMHRHHEIQLQL